MTKSKTQPPRNQVVTIRLNIYFIANFQQETRPTAITDPDGDILYSAAQIQLNVLNSKILSFSKLEYIFDDEMARLEDVPAGGT
jgi:hypothetical protein